MKRKDKHINKFLSSPLPDPEIPADDAWAGMNGMLEASGDQGLNGPGPLSQIWKSIAKFNGLVIVAAISVLIALLVLTHQTENSTSNQSVTSKNRDSAISTKNPGPGLANIQSVTHDSPPDTSAVLPTGITAETVSEKVRFHSNNVGRPDNAKNTSATPSASPRVRITAASVSATHAGIAQGAGIAADARAKRNDTHSAIHPTGTSVSSQVTQESFTSFDPEKVVSNATQNNHGAANMSPNFLQPRAGHFKSAENDLTRFVKKPVPDPARSSPKIRKPLFTNLHFGPEWAINRSLVSTDYMVTGADSTRHPARLAIPGLFVSKSWNRHSVTLIFNPLHTYFGEKERVAQKIDTTYASDSTVQYIKRNTNFIKAFGINFALQYQFRATSWLSLVGGASYARYSAALLRKENEYAPGWFTNESHLTARGKETLKSYIHPQQWNIRVGILFHEPTVFNNRLQLGMNILIPVSNLSLNGFKSVKSPNSQVSLRFLIK